MATSRSGVQGTDAKSTPVSQAARRNYCLGEMTDASEVTA